MRVCHNSMPLLYMDGCGEKKKGINQWLSCNPTSLLMPAKASNHVSRSIYRNNHIMATNNKNTLTKKRQQLCTKYSLWFLSHLIFIWMNIKLLFYDGGEWILFLLLCILTKNDLYSDEKFEDVMNYLKMIFTNFYSLSLSIFKKFNYCEFFLQSS